MASFFMTDLKVFVAYQDFATGLAALRTYEAIVRLVDEGYAFAVDFWRFEVLLDPPIAEQVAAKAAQADVVMIAVADGQDLPPEMKSWIETWIDQKAGQDSALALLSRVPSEAARGYLRDIAQRGRMTFIFEPGRNQ